MVELCKNQIKIYNNTLAQIASSAEKRVGQALRRYSLVVSTAALSDMHVAITQLTSWVLNYKSIIDNLKKKKLNSFNDPISAQLKKL